LYGTFKGKEFDMPRDLRMKVNKRKTFFMEHLATKKLKSRVDVYMEHLKQISNKEIYEIDDKDVLEYLIFKDVNDSGRTIVHKENCPHIGTPSADSCIDKIQCGLRHQAESMRIGIVDKLRKGFEELEEKVLIVPWTKWGILHVLSWSGNIYLLLDKNRESLGCFLREQEIWKDLKWTD